MLEAHVADAPVRRADPPPPRRMPAAPAAPPPPPLVRRRPAAPPSAPPAPAPSTPPAAVPADAGSRVRWIVPVVSAGLLGAALVLLHRELAGARYRTLVDAVHAIPDARLALAALLTGAAYAIMSGYDVLALRYVRLRLPLRRVVATSAAAYAVSQTLGFAAVTGNAVRYRFWSAWGLTGAEIGQAAGFVGATFTIGLLATCGLALAVEPPTQLVLLGLPVPVARVVGALLLGAVAAYVGWSARRQGRPLAIGGWRLPVPGPRLALAQLALAALDWAVAAAVLRVLLPATPGLGFVAFAGAFTLAQCAGLVSHVPGGLGVFDALIVLLLQPHLPVHVTLAGLVAYRGVYYLLPFALALTSLAVSEAVRQRARLTAAAGATRAVVARVGPVVLPTALSATTFLAGVLLMVSGATPSVLGRIRALDAVLPLGVIEISHFAGSLAGLGLVLLAGAMRRRLDAAYGLTVALLVVGIVASLFKGLDYEEALVLGAVLAVVLPTRRAFYRPTALTSEPPTLPWLAAALAVVGASVWIGLFAFAHVEYAHDLWWRFTARGDAPRFLRASAGAVVALGVLGVRRLLRPAVPVPALPDEPTLQRAAAIVRTVPDTTPHVALLGDKALLFGAHDDAFVMYAVSGRSWIALGDPVGPPSRRTELAWRFREEADRHGAWPVFYQVGAEQLGLYIDLGLTFLKMGEEAHVMLDRFTLTGSAARDRRRALLDGEKHRLSFEIVPADGVAALLPTLRTISDDWLGGRTTREKGFSLGRFDEAYLGRTPLALVRAEGRPVAFANLWLAAPGTEIAPDLMRHTGDAPRGVMDYLFVELLRWGRAEGFARANLGMAPLSGLEARRLAPLWSRTGALVARRGEHFYNFRGLRAFKEKFDPVWVPKYLASPGGLALPRVLTNVAALISGGIGGMVRK